MLKENSNCCLFEFDQEEISTRMPDKKNIKLPKIAVMCFFKEVIDEFSKLDHAELIMESYHDIIAWKFYKININSVDMVFCYAPMGAPLCVNIMEDLFANGVDTVIACGGCGVLNNIIPGKILLPTTALRDEGTSFHYMKPTKEIILDKEIVLKTKNILSSLNIEYIECKTWTTDASKRETSKKIELRKKQGCQTVEMECSALAACAKFRNKKFVELLYSGDLLNNVTEYDNRNWQFNRTSREKLFNISLQVASRIISE